jgi:hypothetical protein
MRRASINRGVRHLIPTKVVDRRRAVTVLHVSLAPLTSRRFATVLACVQICSPFSNYNLKMKAMPHPALTGLRSPDSAFSAALAISEA